MEKQLSPMVILKDIGVKLCFAVICT